MNINSFLLVITLITVSFSDVIGINSVIDIRVQNHSEFSGKYKVDPSGTINYPLLADEQITNMTTSELMNELTFRLAKHIDNPLVLISIIKKPPITVTVLGAVVTPGPVEVISGATPQEILKPAGGPTMDADLSIVKIIKANAGPDNSTTINLNSFLKHGIVKDLPILENGDMVIILSKDKKSKVKVIGAVNKPGFYEIEDSINVFEMIYMAGGPIEKADLSKVRRFTKYDNKETEEILNIKDLTDHGEMSKIPKVNEGDIIIVYSKWFDWKMFMTVLTNVLLFIVTIQSIKTAVS